MASVPELCIRFTFDLPHNTWENNDIQPDGQRAHSQKLLELSEDFRVEQMQMNTTREKNTF